MKRIRIDQPWMREVLPRGWPVGTSTVITGADGTGKSFVGRMLADSWLRQGGSVVFVSLQHPSHESFVAGFRRVPGTDLDACADRVASIVLDTGMDGLVVESPGRIRANLGKPAVWDQAIQQAALHVPAWGPGILLFASALNLLLFSPTYGAAILDRMKRTLASHGDKTVVFAVSTSARSAQVAELEDLADNVLICSSERDPFRLLARVERMRGGRFGAVPVEIPVSEEILAEAKDLAERNRRRVMPMMGEI